MASLKISLSLTLIRAKLPKKKKNLINPHTGIALRKGHTHNLLIRIYKTFNNDQHKKECPGKTYFPLHNFQYGFMF